MIEVAEAKLDWSTDPMKPELENLKTNDLQQVAVKVESFYERHDAAIRWGIIGVAFVLACGIYWWRVTAATEAAAWNQFSQSNSAEDFAEVASDFPNSRVANWAKLREANAYLETALRDAFSNREKADTDLKKAKGLLESLKSLRAPRDLRQQTLFAYARCLEMTSDGDLQPAIAAYEELLKEFPETTFKRDAEIRIKALSKPSAKEFYAFFSKQKPMPEERPKPNDASKKGAGGDDPFKPLTKDLEDAKQKTQNAENMGTPLLLPPKLPDLTDTEKPAAASGKAAEEIPETDKKPTTPAEAEKSTESKQAEVKSEEKKPEEKPSEEKTDAPKTDAPKTDESAPSLDLPKTSDKDAEKKPDSGK